MVTKANGMNERVQGERSWGKRQGMQQSQGQHSHVKSQQRRTGHKGNEGVTRDIQRKLEGSECFKKEEMVSSIAWCSEVNKEGM